MEVISVLVGLWRIKNLASYRAYQAQNKYYHMCINKLIAEVCNKNGNAIIMR
jgi:hypothetical protein